jgi:hypothetical protein
MRIRICTASRWLGWALLLGAYACAGCTVPVQENRELAERCARIRNEGIEIDGTDAGLLAWVVGEHERWVLTTPLNPYPYLLRALEDPDRWIAAHVLLSERWLRDTGTIITSTGTDYNGLEIILYADGTKVADLGQQAKIKEHWSRVLQAEKSGY